MPKAAWQPPTVKLRLRPLHTSSSKVQTAAAAVMSTELGCTNLGEVKQIISQVCNVKFVDHGCAKSYFEGQRIYEVLRTPRPKQCPPQAFLVASHTHLREFPKQQHLAVTEPDECEVALSRTLSGLSPTASLWRQPAWMSSSAGWICASSQ